MRSFTASGAVKQYPGAKALAKGLEVVWHARRHEEEIARTKSHALVTTDEFALPFDNEVALIAFMRLLQVAMLRAIQLDIQLAALDRDGERII